MQTIHKSQGVVQPTVIPFRKGLKAAKRACIIGVISVDLLDFLIGYDKVIAILIVSFRRGEIFALDGHDRTDADELSREGLGERSDDREAGGVQLEGKEEVLQFCPVVAVATGRAREEAVVVAQLRVGTEEILHHVLRARRVGIWGFGVGNNRVGAGHDLSKRGED